MKNLVGEFDAKVWVECWMEAIRENPSIPTDEGAMIGWFANAIMSGYDNAAQKYKRGGEFPRAYPASELTKEQIESLLTLGA